MRMFIAHNHGSKMKPCTSLAAAVAWIKTQMDPGEKLGEPEALGSGNYAPPTIGVYCLQVDAGDKFVGNWYVVVEEVVGTHATSEPLTLFDDASVKEKLTVMSKWDAMIDDSRNPENDFEERVEAMLKPNKKYVVVVLEVDDARQG